MGTFPTTSIQYTQATPTGQTANPRANLDVNQGAGAIGAGMAELGQTIEHETVKVQVQQDAMDLSEVNREDDNLTLTTQEQLRKTVDPTAQEKIIADYEAKRAALAANRNRRVQNAYQKNVNNSMGQRKDELLNIGLRTREKAVKDKLDFLVTQDIANGNYEALLKDVGMAHGTGVINEDEANLILLKGKGHIDNQLHDSAYLSVEGGVQDLIKSGKDIDVTQQYILEQVKKNPKLTPDDERRLIENSHGYFNNYHEYENRKEKSDAYTKDLTISKQLIDNIMQGNTNPDQMAGLASKGSSELKERWNDGLFPNIYAEPPTVTTVDGLKTVTNTINGISKGTVKNLDAYDELLQARYVDRTITDTDFKFAIDKVEHPYPKHVAEMLGDVMGENETRIHEQGSGTEWRPWSWFHESSNESAASDEKTKETNSKLLHWVDAELQKSPNRTFTPKELYEMKAQVGATTRTGDATRLMAAPDVGLDPYWNKLNNDQKRLIWKALDKGVPVDAILNSDDLKGLK